MNVERKADEDQAALWNGAAGCAWVEAQAVMDEMLAPFEQLLAEFVAGEAASSALDIGCGTGATTLAAARAMEGKGDCVGIDISAPMIEVARKRATREGSRARFICDDAQTHAFEPETFDAIISRFGVMFFEDNVRAFANLRRAARLRARMRFIAWRSPAENPFMTTAERAAAPLLPNLPPRKPDAPGQFAFADQNRVHRILAESGWRDIDIEALDVVCRFPTQALEQFTTRFGPIGRALDQADAATRRRVVEAVRAAFDPYVGGADVRFNAACWMVSARAGKE